MYKMEFNPKATPYPSFSITTSYAKIIPLVHKLFSKCNRQIIPLLSPSEQKCFSFSIPKKTFLIKFVSHSWSFLVDQNNGKQISLFNPVSKRQIKFSPLMIDLSFETKGFLSASPLSPDCVALIMDADAGGFFRAFLYWPGQKEPKWTSLHVPTDFYYCFYNIRNVYCKGKFYLRIDKFFVVDSVSTTPTISVINMDCSQLPCKYNHTLVELNGEVLMVALIYNYGGRKDCKAFEVFKADFSKMKWVRLESIGDRALFVASHGSFCVLANDVGCKSNSVYLQKHLDNDRELWRVFDMGTMEWSDGPPFYKEDYAMWFGLFTHWFLPSLDYNI